MADPNIKLQLISVVPIYVSLGYAVLGVAILLIRRELGPKLLLLAALGFLYCSAAEAIGFTSQYMTADQSASLGLATPGSPFLVAILLREAVLLTASVLVLVAAFRFARGTSNYAFKRTAGTDHGVS
jgi:hypothetical protein